jgi:hypothetical protein
LKHQQTKNLCLIEFEKYLNNKNLKNCEIKKGYLELSNKMDEFLGILDKENCLKRSFIINKIKTTCIAIYKKSINFNVSDLELFIVI